MPDVYTKIIANVHHGDGGGGHKDTPHDTILLHRPSMAKSRHLARTESGDEVGISLGRGVTLRDGDVLQGPGGRLIAIRQAPEKVARIKFTDALYGGDDHGAGAHLLAGHIIGNRHRPISIREGGRMVVFPIQDDAELETFKMLFGRMGDLIEIQASDEIFTPEEGADVQGHQ